MHGQHCEERQQQWHMWPGPSQLPVLGTVADSASFNCFSKAGRKISIGDCALFQAGNALPFIGIIRKLTAEKEGNLKLGVNWLYRPGDIKLAKGVPLEASPNEIFYSFHKDEISAASLLHPCKVAFLRKGVEQPSGVPSFVCRRVYDTANKCLYWLTDQDYTDERQEEVDQLLDRTKHEMQAAVQSGGPSQRVLTGPTSSQQPKAEVILNAVFPTQGKGKKRERTDQSLDPCKRERSMKLEDCDLGHLKRECSMKPEEIANITDKDGGLTNIPNVDQLVHVMHQERNDSIKKLGDAALRRTMLARIVAATEREDCLTRFVQLGGLPVLDDWLQEAHKGKVGDGGSPKEGDKGLEELLLILLRALDKLPVDLDALKTCMVGKSVNNLRSHRNSEIQKKARKLVDTWKKRVDAEMKLSGESKSGSNPATPWSCKQPSSETHGMKGRAVTEGGSVKSTAGVKPITNGCCPGDLKCCSISVSGCKEPPVLSSSISSKDNHAKSHASGTGEVPLAPLASVKEEKSSSSSQSQNNSQSWCSGPVKGAGSSWKDEAKTSSAVSTGTKATTTTVRSHSYSGKGQPTASSTGCQKELVGGKHLVWNRAAVNEKVVSSALVEKGSAESVRGENSNNQRLIVRLPNPGRSPARSTSGGSLPDVAAPTSRGSSPGSSERHELVDGKCRMLSTTPAVHSPETSGDTKSGSGGKSGAGCGEKERSCVVPADEGGCRFSDADHRPKESEPSLGNLNNSAAYGNKGLVDGVQSGDVKKVTSAAVAAAGSTDTCAEVPGLDANEDGIDLLASVAASEGSEAEKSVGVGSAERQAALVNDGNREPGKQTRLHSEADSKNQSENCLVTSHEDEKGKKGDGLIDSRNAGVKGLSELGCTNERVEPGSFSGQEPVEDLGELPRVSTSEQSLEERAREGATESTLVSTDCSFVKDTSVAASRGTEGSVGSQDGCGGAKLARKEISMEEKAKLARLATDLCNGSSLSGEGQTGIASRLDSAGSPEEGFEDGRKVCTSPSTLVRVSSVGDMAKAGEAVSGYYEEDALEVARQVAKEVEQEMERYGKPETQDVNSVSICKNEQRKETPVPDAEKNPWSSPSEVDARVKGTDQDRHRSQELDAVVYSDDSQETVTEKREDTEAERTPAAGEGEEVDQVSCTVCSPDRLRPALDSTLGSVVDNIEEVKGVATLEEDSHSSPAVIRVQSATTAVCNVQTGEATVPDQAVALTAVSNDGACGSSDASGRPVFDLNEGFVADEALQDDATASTISSLNPATPFPDSQSGPPAMPNSLAAPIAVVAATKGPFIPPSSPLRCKGEPGWKGSAATSAFRPAEPRRAAELFQSASDAAAAAADITGPTGKRARILDIDLNVADERVLEDVALASTLPVQNSVLGMVLQTTSPGSSCQAPVASSNECSSSGLLGTSSSMALRPELDLNRVDESEECMTALVSESRCEGGLTSSTRSNNNFPLATTRVMLDFDLNDGLCLEEAAGEEPAIQQCTVKSLGNPTLPVLPGLRTNADLVNVAPWYPSGNPLHTMVMPAFSASRAESSYPVVAAPTAKPVMNVGHSLSPFNGDLYRAGAVVSSSPSVSYSSTMPAAFPYAGFPFGSGFPFTSASFAMNSSPYVESPASAPFPTAPSQLVSAGAVVSPYVRPYLMGIAEVAGAESGASWSRPNLDLNAGPDPVDTDVRDDGIVARQVTAVGQLSFQQAGTSGGPLKRKEPESGFDPFRSGFKQMTWR